MEKFISKINLKKMLKALAQDAVLVGPVKVHDEVIFQKADSVGEIVFNYENCLNSPKDYLLLNDEVLFQYSKGLPFDSAREEPFPKIVIFGSRPCDSRAVNLLDKFFARKFEDPVYFNKRKSTLIITLACAKLGKSCFCTSTGSGPYLKQGFDLQLIDIGTGFYLEAASIKAKELVQNFASLMDGVDANKKNKKEKAVEKAANSKRPDFNLKEVYKRLDKSSVEEGFWQDLGRRCQSCGGCLLVCPTCSCFYVADKKKSEEEGQRVRCLDACYYEGFTRLAGDYNPVSSRPLMMRRKFFHKLWQQIDEFEQSGCTGCGRCSEICPGNINWLESIKKIEAGQDKNV